MVVKSALQFFAAISITILVVFNLRRILFTIAAVRAKGPRESRDHTGSEDYWPEILVLIPCRNEEGMIPGLSDALSALDYPTNRLQVAWIDDGSHDGTLAKMEKTAKGRPGWHVLHIPNNLGKASALNQALASFHFGELLYVLDADHRPSSTALKRAVGYFEDPVVAGISGFTQVANTHLTPSVYYATVESRINQLVTMRAKDSLDLAPALLGSNCLYRRDRLVECGGFRPGAFSEDSDLTLTFYEAGYRVRFAEDVLSYHQAPPTVQGYLKQHIRWGRGLNDVSKLHTRNILRNSRLRLPLRIELLIFSTGYLDRIALLGAAFLSLVSWLSRGAVHFPYGIFLFALVTPFFQIITLFVERRAPAEMWIRLPLIPLFFALDVYAALRALVETIISGARVWTETERTPVSMER